MSLHHKHTAGIDLFLSLYRKYHCLDPAIFSSNGKRMRGSPLSTKKNLCWGLWNMAEQMSCVMESVSEIKQKS